MNPLILVGLGALGIWGWSQTKTGGASVSNRLHGLPDVEPSLQKGGYSTEHDFIFESVADETGVPFALLKAHALMESSLNENAFRDENPYKRADRQGWASRGLMQILWWPGSERWKKYGWPDSSLGVDGVRMFEPYINVSIAARLIRDNLKATKGSVLDAIDMYNDGNDYKRPAPHDYAGRVLKFYETLIGGSVL